MYIKYLPYVNYRMERFSILLPIEGSILPPEDTISSHYVDDPFVEIACLFLCMKEPKCVGFNCRITTMDEENCQLANITSNKNPSKTGDWTLWHEIETMGNFFSLFSC